MGKSIEPIASLSRRVQEQGRIRIGVKDAARGMKPIDTFRFTSPDQGAIEQIAEVYGGTARPWSDDRANQKNQFEVITTAPRIRVLVTPGGLSQFYELWTGGGCQRRCDGVMCEIPIHSDDTTEWDEVPCLCEHRDKHLLCKVKTRITVILPEIRFAGGWRLETSSMNAAREMPGMEQLIAGIQSGGLTEGVLEIADGKSGSGKQTKRYKYPKLSINVSMEQLAAGEGTFAAIPAGPNRSAPALGAGVPELDADHMVDIPMTADHDPIDVDGEVVDGEIVDDGPWSTMKAAMEATGEPSKTFVKESPGKWVRRA